MLKPVYGVCNDLKGVHKERKGPIGSWFVCIFPVDECIGPEEVDSCSFKGCAKGDFLEPLTLRCLTPVFRSNSEKVASIPERKR